MMSKANIRFDKSLYDCASFTINTQVLEKAYKLDCDVCRSKSNKNCSQNPRCLNGLGEKTWLNDEIDDQLLNGNKDPNSERRVLSSFVGLKNLGATCYVNSLLQVWYHNPILREAIYKWCPDFDPIELSHQEHLLNTCNNEDIDYVPITAIAKLQLIFAFMQFGLRRFVDPSPIIKCLELDESQQQDAHEFSNLFISLIEKKLAFQRDNTINKIIENQYCGKCAYITRCQTCGESSRNESRFYELDLNIKGCKDIFDCLDQYLKEENLEGNNQYYCGKCKSKQNAIRFIQLEKLPPVLTLQLLRFVYDPQKGGKKKLNSFLRFPDTLLMTPFIKSFSPNTKAEMTYHLSAVLIHRGPSAHSGHYIAHIKDNKTCSWYKFNDEKVEKIEGHKLKLDSDDGNDETCNAENIADKSKDKGWHCSNNAYMLVYKNETQQTPDLADNYEAWNVPKYLRKIIDDDNIKFEQFVSELEVQRNLSICENKRHQQEVKNTYKSLLAVPNSPYEFISKAWLTNWLSCQHYNSLQPVDNTQILCEHGNLNAVALSSFKCISAYGADIIYEKYGGGPRLDKNSLCRTCICQQANISQIKSEIEKDQKIISSQLKYTLSPDEECYWVGKQSLRNWKNIRLKSVSIECNDNATENNFSDNSSVSKCDNFTFESNGSKFNNEIICIHGQLSPKESNRRLVASLIWQVFKKHFPDAPQFSKDSDICLKCISMEEQLESLKIQNKGIANEQKNNLPNLYNGRQRLCWEELTCDTPYYVLSKKFHKIWKNFINDPSKYEPPNEIENLDLFCAHHLFLYPPKQIDLLDDKSKFIVITNDEWVKLTDYYSFDFSIKISVCNQNGNTLIESNPSHCVSCHQSLILEEERNRLTYTNQHIYIRRIENIESLSDSACDKKDETSDNYQRLNKKQKTEDLTLSGSVRRSSRRRKNKNETEIKVSSTDTLKDLKVQIMKIFKVATYDQQLYLNDTLLTNTEKTLAQLHIEPQSIIILKVDEEPSGDCSIIEDDYIKGSTPEIGFKGTQLQH